MTLYPCMRRAAAVAATALTVLALSGSAEAKDTSCTTPEARLQAIATAPAIAGLAASAAANDRPVEAAALRVGLNGYRAIIALPNC